MGVLLAWVLVRCDFPGKRMLDGLIELPFALPTAIAGITLTSLTVPGGWIGRVFAPLGLKIAYTKVGIVVALVFVGIPFVVRSVQPVLEKLDGSFEESAFLMGADNWHTFRRVIWPEIRPAALTGFGMALARGLGEYGSVVFIAGNKPYATEIAPLMIMGQLQSYDYGGATAIALVMLAASFLILLLMNIVQARAARRTGG
jgi:sulfate transport system permease protein